MNLNISGKVVAILPKVSGTSAKGAWEKQDFVIEEMDGEWPKKVVFTVFNKPALISDLRVDDEVDVSFQISATEYNGKWFDNVTAWKVNITKISGAKPNLPPAADLPPMGDVPQGGEDQGDKDDLPF